MTLRSPYRPAGHGEGETTERVRLWIAELQTPEDWESYLEHYGFPIRYKYVRQGWPLSYYQTVYTTQKGSAEMPSAGRAFTPELITALVAKGVQVAPLLLHTGVASLEEGEPPYEEYFNVPAPSARLINLARTSGQRVIAVGTTAVRALESADGYSRQAASRRGLDGPGDYPAARLAHRRWLADWFPRVEIQPPVDAGSTGRLRTH